MKEFNLTVPRGEANFGAALDTGRKGRMFSLDGDK